MRSRVALVTGALTGIGRATAVAFATQGYSVVLSGRDHALGARLADELQMSASGDVAFIGADVRFEEQVAALVERTIDRFGGRDVAVNNAGTEGALAPVTALTPELYSTVFDTNVLGTVLSMKHELLVMQSQRSGAIVNVSSIWGHRGIENGALYAASKHAIIGLTRAAALEAVKYTVRVNAIGPGFVDTAMLSRVAGSDEGRSAIEATIPQARAGTADEIAGAIVFLAGEGASYLTGHTLFVDGGVSAG